MSEAIKINAVELLLINAYNKAHNQTTSVIHTPPTSTIGGVSATFVSIGTLKHIVTLRKANGDLFMAPISEITIRVSF